MKLARRPRRLFLPEPLLPLLAREPSSPSTRPPRRQPRRLSPGRWVPRQSAGRRCPRACAPRLMRPTRPSTGVRRASSTSGLQRPVRWTRPRARAGTTGPDSRSRATALPVVVLLVSALCLLRALCLLSALCLLFALLLLTAAGVCRRGVPQGSCLRPARRSLLLVLCLLLLLMLMLCL